MTIKIAVATGGSGGHVFPALAFCEQLENQNVSYFIVADRRVRHLLPDQNSHALNIKPSCSKIYKKIISFSSILLATHKIRALLQKEKPNIVVSFGSYASVPTVLAANLLKIPIIMHEQNTVLGNAHNMFIKKAVAIATAFPKVERLEKEEKFYIGNPIRTSIANLYGIEYKIEEKEPFNVLILGGSQGSREVDELTCETIIELTKYNNIRVAHQSRPESVKGIAQRYESFDIKHTVSHFFDDVCDKLKNAHIVICRAGASTIAENIISGRPGIYIPHSCSYHDHQLKNAVFIEQNGAGIVYNRTQESLINILKKLLQSPQQLIQMSQQCQKIALPKASSKLAEIALKYAHIQKTKIFV